MLGDAVAEREQAVGKVDVRHLVDEREEARDIRDGFHLVERVFMVTLAQDLRLALDGLS